MKKIKSLVTKLSLNDCEILQKAIGFKLQWLDNPKAERWLSSFDKENKEEVKATLAEAESYFFKKIEDTKRKKIKVEFDLANFKTGILDCLQTYYEEEVLPNWRTNKTKTEPIVIYHKVKKLKKDLYSKITEIEKHNDYLDHCNYVEEWIIKDGKVVNNDN